MATPPNTMLKYVKKLTSKPVVDLNTSAPSFNQLHVNNFNIELFDNLLENTEACDTNYISSIASEEHQPFKVKKRRGQMRAKLLQFHEDVRPPYFGTWRKHSSVIKGRRPFSQDDDVFDYDVDSEAEWDIGGPGESLKDSEEEDEIDDYEIDMKTFVPHGYVSDDEVDESPISHSQQQQQQQQQNQSLVPPQHKINMKPIMLGITFKNPPDILREFEGVTC